MIKSSLAPAGEDFLCYRKFLAFQYVAGFSKNREAIVATESPIPFFML